MLNDAVETRIDANGRLLMVEPHTPGLTQRVFRYTQKGALEYCTLKDWEENGERARFYGYAPEELPRSMQSRESD